MKILRSALVALLIFPLIVRPAVTQDASGGIPVNILPFATGSWRCSLDNIGATLTECLAPQGAGIKAYISWITVQSTTAVAGLFLVRTGTKTTNDCDTTTTSIYPSNATVARYVYPPNTAAPLHVTFPAGAPATAANSQLCVICTATNTCTIAMGGPLSP